MVFESFVFHFSAFAIFQVFHSEQRVCFLFLFYFLSVLLVMWTSARPFFEDPVRPFPLSRFEFQPVLCLLFVPLALKLGRYGTGCFVTMSIVGKGCMESRDALIVGREESPPERKHYTLQGSLNDIPSSHVVLSMRCSHDVFPTFFKCFPIELPNTELHRGSHILFFLRIWGP